MKKLILATAVILSLIGFTTVASAESIPVPAKEGFSITTPMETAPTGFWFPTDGTFAAGISHTFLRIQHSAIPKLRLDADGTIAQEVSQDKDTLAGLGLKLAYKNSISDKKGLVFEPSLGLCALNNFTKFKRLNDIADNYKVAVYGTILLYKW